MRIDDPQVMKAIEQLEDACDTLRRLAGFEPRFPNPDTYASRRPAYDCPILGCSVSCRSKADLEAHVETMHDRERVT